MCGVEEPLLPERRAVEDRAAQSEGAFETQEARHLRLHKTAGLRGLDVWAEISNNKAPIAYTFDLNVSAGSHTIKVNAGNTGTERYPFVDFVTFPGSGSTDPGGDRDADGIPDTEDNCPDVYNRQ